MTSIERERHPDPETLGSFAEGRLQGRARDVVLQHLMHCNVCLSALDAANESIAAEAFRSPNRGATRRAGWLAAAAAVVITLFGVAVYRHLIAGNASTPMTKLVTASAAETRWVEPRLSGGFGWAEYRGPVRDENAAPNKDQLRVHGAAGEVLAEAEKDRSSDAQHAAGVAMLLIDRPQDAIEKLRALAEHSPNDANVWSDLAAAYYTTALRQHRASLYPEALAAADHALRIDASQPVALFNRALVLDRMGLRQQAAQAWKAYLAVDGTSKWAEEARAHLARLEKTADTTAFKNEFPKIEAWAASGNTAAIRDLVTRFPQRARATAEVDTLKAWADAVSRGQPDDATAKLRMARSIGDVLQATTGETLLRDAVQAIETANDQQRFSLVQAHIDYQRGRLAYSRKQLAEGLSALQSAAAGFVRGGSPMALTARYYAANVAFDQNQVDAAHTELTALLEELAKTPGYKALRAQVLWERALTLVAMLHWSEAVADFETSRALFEELGETNNRAFVDIMIAEVTSVGDHAWERRINAFTTLSEQNMGDRLLVALHGAVTAEVRAHNTAAAASLLDLQIEESRSSRDPLLLADGLRRRALLRYRTGGGDPQRDIAEARATMKGVADPALAARAEADADLVEGIICRTTDPKRSAQLLSATAAFYRGTHRVFFPAALLERGRTYRDARDLGAAWTDFNEGIREIETRKVPGVETEIEAAGLFDSESSLYGGAVDLALAEGDDAKAFEYADRALQQALRARFGGSPVATRLETNGVASRVQASVPDGTAILELYVLDNDLVLFTVTHDAIHAARLPNAASLLRADAHRLLSALAERRDIEPIASSLHDRIFASVRDRIAGTNRLVVVADARLGFIPFAALYDKAHQRYLVEDYELVYRPAAGIGGGQAILPVHVPPSVLIVADPEHDSSTVRLAGAEEEAEAIATVYPKSDTLAGASATRDAVLRGLASHRIVHFAGHADANDQPAPSLLLARGATDGGRLYATDIAKLDLHNVDLVVLAACRTTRDDISRAASSRDLTTAFLAGGARSVIGTGWEIDDQLAPQQFEELHRAVARGVSAATAVRDVQLHSLHDSDASRRHPSAWAALSVMSLGS